MRLGVAIVDDFYDDFEGVRAAALAAEYEPEGARRGPYPGRNSVRPHASPEAEGKLRAVLAGLGIDWRPNPISGTFRTARAGERGKQYVHFDLQRVTGVVYLTAAEQCAGRAGTCFWKHKRTGSSRVPDGGANEALAEIIHPDGNDPAKWELELAVPMAANRLVLFDSRLFHSEAENFGVSVETSRLVQVW